MIALYLTDISNVLLVLHSATNWILFFPWHSVRFGGVWVRMGGAKVCATVAQCCCRNPDAHTHTHSCCSEAIPCTVQTASKSNLGTCASQNNASMSSNSIQNHRDTEHFDAFELQILVDMWRAALLAKGKCPNDDAWGGGGAANSDSHSVCGGETAEKRGTPFAYDMVSHLVDNDESLLKIVLRYGQDSELQPATRRRLSSHSAVSSRMSGGASARLHRQQAVHSANMGEHYSGWPSAHLDVNAQTPSAKSETLAVDCCMSPSGSGTSRDQAILRVAAHIDLGLELAVQQAWTNCSCTASHQSAAALRAQLRTIGLVHSSRGVVLKTTHWNYIKRYITTRLSQPASCSNSLDCDYTPPPAHNQASVHNSAATQLSKPSTLKPATAIIKRRSEPFNTPPQKALGGAKTQSQANIQSVKKHLRGSTSTLNECNAYGRKQVASKFASYVIGEIRLGFLSEQVRVKMGPNSAVATPNYRQYGRPLSVADDKQVDEGLSFSLSSKYYDSELHRRLHQPMASPESDDPTNAKPQYLSRFSHKKLRHLLRTSADNRNITLFTHNQENRTMSVPQSQNSLSEPVVSPASSQYQSEPQYKTDSCRIKAANNRRKHAKRSVPYERDELLLQAVQNGHCDAES